MNEYFGVKVEDLSLTQINAYVLEIAKDLKHQKERLKGPQTVLDNKAKLTDLKNLGFKIKGKNGRR